VFRRIELKQLVMRIALVALVLAEAEAAFSLPQVAGGAFPIQSPPQSANLGGGGSATFDRATGTLTVFSSDTKSTAVSVSGAAGATLLSLIDGSTWLEGLVDANGRPARGRKVDTTIALSVAPDDGLVSYPESRFVTLPNGNILVVSGNGTAASIWNPLNHQSTSIAIAVGGNVAGLTLLRDGAVLIDDGTPASQSSQVIDPSVNATRPLSAVEIADISSPVPAWSAVMPAPESVGAAPSGAITIGFSVALDPATVNSRTVVLFGPGGAAPATVRSLDNGHLVVVTPLRDLFTASRYTVLLKGLQGKTGVGVPFGSYGFSTAALGTSKALDPVGNSSGGNTTSLLSGTFTKKEAAAVAGKGVLRLSTGSVVTGITKSNEGCVAGSKAVVLCRRHSQIRDGAFYPGVDATLNAYGGHWRTYQRHVEALGKPLRLARTLTKPKLQAVRANASGPGSVTGRVLTIDGRPIQGVSVSSNSLTTKTGEDGVFTLAGLPTGQQTIFVDGISAGRRDVEYGSFEVGITVPVVGTLKLSYNMYLPRVLARDKVSIPSPTTQDIAITHPDIPGLEIDIPAGTVIHDRNGKVVTDLAIVPTPVDRAPFPTNNNYPVYFSLIPGGAVIQNLSGEANQGIRIKYPNYSHEKPGTVAKFWNYDTTSGWRIYGKGRVSADGTQFVPDSGVALTTTIHGSFTLQQYQAGLNGTPNCGCNGAGDPVDLVTGALVHTWHDLGMTDIIPLSLDRTYRSGDTTPRAFGVGMSSSLDWYLYDEKDDYSEPKLVLPNLSVIPFEPILGDPALSDGDALAEWKATGVAGSFQGATLQHLQYTNNHYEEHWVVQMRTGQQYWFQNEQENRLDQIVDRFGNATSFDLSSGLLDSVTSPSGRTISFSYDGDNRISSATDSAGRTVNYVYNAAGYLSEVDYPDATNEKYAYDATGELLTITDRRGNVSLTNQWVSGRVSQQTFADNTTVKLTYVMGADGYSTKTTVTEPNGTVNVTTFDASTHYPLTETVAFGTPSAQTTTYTRDAVGNTTSVVDSLGRKATMVYDAVGNMTTLTALAGTPQATTELFTYSSDLSLVTSITDPLGHITHFDYTNGCMTAVTNALGKVVHATCNTAGQSVSVTDPLGHGVTYSYFGTDVRSRVDALGRTTTFTTDGLGRVIAMRDAMGNMFQTSYDVDDRVVQVADARGNVTQYAYDNNGNILSVTAPDNKVISFTYDSSNRVTQRKDALGQIAYFTHDTLGNIATAKDRKGQTTTLHYDLLGRRDLTTFADGSTIAQAYDAANRLTGLTDSLNGVITRGYDDFNRLTSETSPQGVVSYQYDAFGRRTQANVAAQSAIVYGYDNANRMTDITQGTDHVVLGYDDANRRASLTLPNGVKGLYTYDTSNALLGIAYSSKTGTAMGSVNYTYDAAGGVASRTGTFAPGVPAVASSASYDVNNRATVFNGAALSYDADGNLTFDGTNTYVWDARNQLTQIKQGGTAVATYTYDALGRRTSRQVSTSTSTAYLYDGEEVAQEKQGSAVNPILGGPGADERFARNESTGRTYFLTDGLASTVALTDATGAAVQQYSYDAYGNSSSVPAASNPYQFTGRENDDNGLYYMRARYYSPAMGRFISEDPTGLTGGINSYAYVGSSPTLGRDPSGKNPLLFAAIGGGVDLAIQLAQNGGDISCVDWGKVGAAALIGAAGGFVGEIGAFIFEDFTAGLAIDASGEPINVFWSGSDAARDVAAEWAEANGGTTLELSSLGRAAAAESEGLPWNEARPIWAKASQTYAESASGVVHVFHGPVVNVESIWATVEWRALLANPRVTEIIFHLVP